MYRRSSRDIKNGIATLWKVFHFLARRSKLLSFIFYIHCPLHKRPHLCSRGFYDFGQPQRRCRYRQFTIILSRMTSYPQQRYLAFPTCYRIKYRERKDPVMVLGIKTMLICTSMSHCLMMLHACKK